MSERTPELTRVKGGWSVRIRCGKGQKPRFLLRVEDESAARARAATMTELARLLVAAGKASEAPVVLRELAEQPTAAAARKVEAFARELCKEGPWTTQAPTLMTFRQLGEAWTRGELARLYPDHVRVKRSVMDDELRLGRLYSSIGDVPLARFGADDAKRAMASLPKTARTSSTRRHYAQLIRRVLK